VSREKPSREWRERISDMLAAIDEIFEFVQGQTSASFAVDAKTLKAVLANFAIMGEAVAQVPEEVRARHPAIAWRQIRDMRNLVVHVYFAIEPGIVWDTIQTDLPELRRQLLAVLQDQ